MTLAPTTSEQTKAQAWYSQAVEKVLTQLGSIATGLSATETKLRNFRKFRSLTRKLLQAIRGECNAANGFWAT
ncbi:MAG: hypothetical protein Q8N35_05615 [Methylococcaceae bacterium]|nr:hypothetical protein [Methylococcaceae bacterium]MDP3019045.1 hypothetical protein [Methylococcaceae bacterium]MDP3390261.1 hypothetical protein [Methylococcaceae bacterium]MDZ4097286.1 hypothetical protein [Methylophilaceae bacterium]